MAIDCASPASGVPFTVALVNMQNEVIATAQHYLPLAGTLAEDSQPGGQAGRLILQKPGLNKDWYFLKIDGPVPTTYTIDSAPKDSDRDTVFDLFDNFPRKSNQDQRDTDKDSMGDACDNCPSHPNPVTVIGMVWGTFATIARMIQMLTNSTKMQTWWATFVTIAQKPPTGIRSTAMVTVPVMPLRVGSTPITTVTSMA